MTDLERFDQLLQSMRETYVKKNHDYGNSFGDTYQEFGEAGIVTAATQISHKYHRLINAVKGASLKVNESIDDTLLDMANYCVLTLIEREKECEKYNT